MTTLRAHCGSRVRTRHISRGVELMMQKLLSILAAMKVQPMDSLHRCFSDYHEAVEHVEDPQYREEIIEVLQTGFTMDEDVIRHQR